MRLKHSIVLLNVARIENLISPFVKDAVVCMLGEEQARKTSALPLSNNTIPRRIQDMSDDVEATVTA
jgi:hypothetical protein